MSSIKIKDFFNGRFFEIPKYQRGYAWERKHISDLFGDIKESIESNSNHYIGTIVLSKTDRDDELFYIVDGQQRITTISMIINELIKDLKKDDQVYYKRFYIQEDNRFRLLPLGRDNEFYINILHENTSIPNNKSQRYLKEAIEEIQDNIKCIPDKLTFLKSIEKLEIMEFTEKSEGDAIRIFQTVNDRGKPLSNMEKSKSLLIYFSNRYLNKKLDDGINHVFSIIFELYDDIKKIGEDTGITLILNKDFNEDNLMRYHFVSFTSENEDPTASYVLNYLRENLTTQRKDKDYNRMESFIDEYIKDLELFFQSMKKILEKVYTEPKYYKVFCILNLSATLYPLIVKLENRGILNNYLTSTDRTKYTFIDLIEHIDVRVYKTRGTDPKADIRSYVSTIKNTTSEESIETWMTNFNNKWMNESLFKSYLVDNIYRNRALSLIFIDYCEFIENKKYTIDDLQSKISKIPTIEHILSQTPKFAPRKLGFKSNDDFVEFEHTLGNLTVLEKKLNSTVQNLNPSEKVESYKKSTFRMTKLLAVEITSNGFTKSEMKQRTNKLVEYLSSRWW